MLSKENFTKEHIEEVRENRKVDRTILERSVYALGLLEALTEVGMPFIFKGGTSLMLLLDSPKRLSTDIDIIVAPGTDVRTFIEKAGKVFPFSNVTEQIRYGRDNIEKRHYQFTYDSPAFGREFYILLDILFEKNNYATTVRKPIKNSLIITNEPYNLVTMPTGDCIMGDKLTAFAPHTTGIPFDHDKELEIIKQMYDVSCLFEVSENFQDVYDSYMNTVAAEISYRGGNMTPEDALMDTIDTAACIAGRGTVGTEYPKLLSGIRAIPTHIFDEKFTAEIAVGKAARVMYAAACVLKNTAFAKVNNPEIYLNANISKSKYKKLTKLRKFDPMAFAYIVKALIVLEGKFIEL